MHVIGTMFKSPRFVVGFIMVLIILCYAIFVPIIFTADPKASRAPNPYYESLNEVLDALSAEDDALITVELEKMRQLAADNEEPLLVEAAKNLVAVVDAIEEELSKNVTDASISALEQVKSSRKYPLINEARLPMKALLEANDIDGARAEGDRLIAHINAAFELADGLAAAAETGDFAKADALTTVFVPETDAELSDILPAIQAQDAAALSEATTDFRDQQETFLNYVNEAQSRLDISLYETAADAAQCKIQKTYLIPFNSPPGSRFWLGTDNFSRDMFLQMAYAARTSLLVGLIAGAIATLIGIVLGLSAGYIGGWVDNLVTVFTNTFIVIPAFIILILISVAIGQFREAWITGVIIGLIAWPWTARAVRAQTASLRFRDHVNMAKITGYSTARIIRTEIMPYIMSYIVMAFILQVASGIMQEATLAILGLGDPTGISLGRLMNWAMEYEAINYNRWWLFLPVAGAIAMITYGLYLMNSGMDQVFNPKIRS